MKPGLLYKLIGHLCQFINRSLQKIPLSKDKCLVLAECLTCLELILVNNHQLVEVHLALMSQINNNATTKSMTDQETSINNKTETSSLSTSSDLITRLERMMTMGGGGGLKLPNVTQSRVTYFYDKESYQSSAHASGQATPSSSSFAANCSQLIGGDGGSTDETNSTKSWLISFCLNYATISASSTPSTAVHAPFVLKCFDLLSIVCKKYFDLLSRDLFFDQLSTLIVNNIDFPTRTCKLNLFNFFTVADLIKQAT